MLVQKSFHQKKGESERKWFVVDAEGAVLGRIATQIADLLRGKGRPTFSYHQDSGDFVVVVNCDKVKLTGNKWDQKKYYTHSRHVSGLKERTAAQQLKLHPELIITNAVKGMLPKGSLGRKQLTKLKVFVGPEHTHSAQNPETIAFK